MIMRDCAPCKLSTRGCLSLVGLAMLLLPGWSLAQKGDEKKEPTAKKVVEAQVIAADGKVTAQPEKGPAQPSHEKRININTLGAAFQDLDADVFAHVLFVQANPAEGDQKLQELEKKLEAMLKELRELRAAQPNAPPLTKPAQAPLHNYQPTATYQLRRALENAPVEAGHQATVKIVGAGGADLAAVIKQLEETIAKNPALKEPLQKAIEALRAAEKTSVRWQKLPEQGPIQGKLAPAQGTVIIEKAQLVPTPVFGTSTIHLPSVNLQGGTYTWGTAAGGNSIALSRATYKLENKAKADALAAFLKEHVKAAIMEVKAEGESLTITTTPETQKAIGQLISVTGGDKTKASSALELHMKVLGDRAERLKAIELKNVEVEVVPTENFIRKVDVKRVEEKKPPEKK